MEDLLYYEDAYMTTFEATILTAATDERGAYVTLDRTAFYPEGGGQPADRGTLHNVAVTDVQKVDGVIRHYVEQPLSEGPVTGQIDWSRRFDHMQQHCGQHMLTAAFVELFDLPTVAFHLGKETVTIDLQTETITDEQLAKAEALANEIILENRPIETKWVTAEEAAHYPLRKQLTVSDNIRLVIIPDFDYNGCGGTHPHTTGSVSMIKILSTERTKQQIRVHFICGQRIRHDLSWRLQTMQQAAQLLSVQQTQIPASVAKLLETQKQLEHALSDAKEQLLTIEIDRLARSTDDLIVEVFEGYSMQQAQKIARTLTTRFPEKTVALVATEEAKMQLVFAKGKQSTSPLNMNGQLKHFLSLINGRGGGNPQFAQGGGDLSISAETMRQQIKEQFVTE